jgi:quercetin dioxygenase-like cupin family protein
MQKIKDIIPKEVVAGITGYYAHGDNLSLGYIVIKAGSVVPEHHHVHEQITYIVEGELDMIIGRELCPLKAGMYHIIPSNTPHSAIAKVDCVAIDVFSPAREDYKSPDIPVGWVKKKE